MTFDKILDNNTLWAVRYDGMADNALKTLFDQWNDPEWLVDFFLANITDLESYFKITDINQAIYDTIDDSQRMQCLILDLSPEANLDKIFRPLENSRTSEMLLGKEKARIKERPQHASWLRIYAIKLEPGCYIITGGAIKLTRTMQEREHTLKELNKMEQVRNYHKRKGGNMKKKTQEFLEAHQSETPSAWREEAEWRRNNWSWLRHSQKIAVKVLLQMKQEGLTQKALAERMNCTQQYVSKILKGKENMSLDTLSKLEDALGISLIYDEQVSYPNMVTEEAFA